MGETREPQPPLSTAARATVTVTFLHFSAGTHLISLPCLLLQAASEDHKDNLKPSNSKDRKTLLCISPEGYRKDLGIKKKTPTSPLDYWYKSNNVSAFFLFFFFKKLVSSASASLKCSVSPPSSARPEKSQCDVDCVSDFILFKSFWLRKEESHKGRR